MTMGQRIAEIRTSLGLSQEQFGEALGVSRQAVSKWESDRSTPQMETLILLSQRYECSLSWLLGVEEEKQSLPESLSPDQLVLVQAVAVETLVASDKTIRKRLFFWLPYGLIFLLSLGLLLLLWSNWDLRQRMQLLGNSHTNVIYSGGTQGTQPEFNDFGYEILSADLSANTLELALYVQPKQITPDSKLTFLVDSGGQVVEQTVTLGQDRYFRATIPCPLRNNIQVSIERDQNGVQELSKLMMLENEWDKSKLACHTKAISQWHGKTVKSLNRYPVTLSLASPLYEKTYYGCLVLPESVRFLLYQNERLVRSYPASLEQKPEYADPIWTAKGSFDVAPMEGDSLTMVCEVTDNYGRISTTLVDQCSVSNESLYSLTSDLTATSQLNFERDYFGIPIDFTGRENS